MNKALKGQVQQRANGVCEYCRAQAQFSPSSFSVEHIIPLVKGGVDDLDNLAFACQGCNNVKFTATEAPDPLTGEVVPLFHPRNDNWDAHFKWDQQFEYLEGITPTGRATVERLQMNRLSLVNLRQALVAFGKHPPVTE